MKAIRVCWVVLAAVALSSASLAAKVKIADGTPIILVMTQTIKSGGPKVGDQLPLKVRDTVYGPGGETAVMNGAPAMATITASEKAKFGGRSGKLDFKVDYLTAADGTKLLTRSMQRKAGERRVAVPLFATLLFLPSIAIRGSNVTVPAGFQFPTYVDGDYSVSASRVAAGPKPLVVGATSHLPETVSDLLETDEYLRSAVTLTNPNAQHCIVNGAMVVTAYDAESKVIGTTLHLDPAQPQQIYSLRPGETRTFVKRLKLDGAYATAQVDIGEPWQTWNPATNKLVDVAIVFSDWAAADTIKGMLRNDSPNTIDGAEVIASIGQDAGLTAFGIVRFEHLKPGETQAFTLTLVGAAQMGAKYTITAVGQTAAAK